MDEILFNILKVVVMLAVLIIFRYIIPMAKELIGAKRLETIEKWVQSAVLMAQQVYWAKDGAERKAIVIDILKEMLESKNISVSDDQLDMLIEAAVKAMKIEESKGIGIGTLNKWYPGQGKSVAGGNTDGMSAADGTGKE